MRDVVQERVVNEQRQSSLAEETYDDRATHAPRPQHSRLPILGVLAGVPEHWPGAGSHVHPAAAAKTSTRHAQMAGMADHAMSGADGREHDEAHGADAGAHGDACRQRARHAVAAELKRAIAKYQTPPSPSPTATRCSCRTQESARLSLHEQRRALQRPFASTPTKPTSLLYKRGADGKLHLVGAMYTMPKNANARPARRPRSAQHRALAQARELVSCRRRATSALARARRTASRCSAPRARSRRKPNATRCTATSIRAVRLDGPRERLRGTISRRSSATRSRRAGVIPSTLAIVIPSEARDLGRGG